MDTKPFRILAIAGSLRQGSYNRGLLRAAQEHAPDWVEVQFFDIGTLPFFNGDVEVKGDPEAVRRLKDAISFANAIDWASRPPGQSVLSNKPVGVMGAVLGRSGSVNAQAILRGVLSRIGAIVIPDPQILVPHASRLFDEQVNLRDEETCKEVHQLVEALAQSVAFFYWCFPQIFVHFLSLNLDL